MKPSSSKYKNINLITYGMEVYHDRRNRRISRKEKI